MNRLIRSGRFFGVCHVFNSFSLETYVILCIALSKSSYVPLLTNVCPCVRELTVINLSPHKLLLLLDESYELLPVSGFQNTSIKKRLDMNVRRYPSYCVISIENSFIIHYYSGGV